MAEIIFSDDPDNPLNQKIIGLFSVIKGHDLHLPKNFFNIKNYCQEIYKMGFDDGQSWAWKMRQMTFVDDPENPGKQKAVFPGDPDYPKVEGFVTVNS